jgi:hypothetical protein
MVDKLHIFFGNSPSPQNGYQRLKDKLSVVVPESPIEQEVIVQTRYDGKQYFSFSFSSSSSCFCVQQN